jgi:SH3-like domain-containing protein
VLRPQAAPEIKEATLKPEVAGQGLKMPIEIVLKEAEFIYKEPNEKSTKVWQFKKGTTVFIGNSEGDWIEVRDADKRKGFVKKDVLFNKQQ